MHQIAAVVWNRIAETQTLQTTFAERLFPLSEEELGPALEEETAKLKKKGVTSPAVRVAYLTMVPLLWESRAIAAFQRQSQRALMPYVETVSEAVMIASLDFPLTSSHQKQLTKLLETKPT